MSNRATARRGGPAGVLLLVAILLLALTGCGQRSDGNQSVSAADASELASEQATGESHSHDHESHSHNGDESPEDEGEIAGSDDASGPGDTEANAPGSDDGSPSPTPSPANPTPQPLEFEGQDGVDVTAELEPTCVTRGQTITITVQTDPKAAVAYHARYYGNEGGAEPPYGQGHGGNDKGQADSDGRYTSAWPVGVEAPFGPGLVDVVVASHGKNGYASPRFEVVETLADC